MVAALGGTICICLCAWMCAWLWKCLIPRTKHLLERISQLDSALRAESDKAERMHDELREHRCASLRIQAEAGRAQDAMVIMQHESSIMQEDRSSSKSTIDHLMCENEHQRSMIDRLNADISKMKANSLDALCRHIRTKHSD